MQLKSVGVVGLLSVLTLNSNGVKGAYLKTALEQSAATLDESLSQVGLTLADALPIGHQQLNAVPVVTVSQRQKIGLLRAPAVDEATLKRHDYNVAMADEALQIGQNIHDLFVLDNVVDFNVLWNTCRSWRLAHMDKSLPKEKFKDFATPREGAGAWVALTPFSAHGKSYGHLVPRLAEKLDDALCGTSSTEDRQAFQYKREYAQNGQHTGTLVALQYKIAGLNNESIPLTTLKTYFNAQGEAVAHPWTVDRNAYLTLSDQIPAHTLRSNRFALSSLMVHSKEMYLASLNTLIQAKLNDFGAFLKESRRSEEASTELRTVDYCLMHDVQLLIRLGEMHYILSHAMFDFRGSSAKSELCIRALAAAAGVELPPFKKGFVPDLESFLLAPKAYVNAYVNAFEYATTS